MYVMSYKKPSYKKTVFDITISMALVGLFVVLLAGFIGQTRKANEIEIRAVDLSAIARGVSQRTDLTIYAPEGLPESWVATSGRLEQIQNNPLWRFGMVSPSGEFVGVKVSEYDAVKMIEVSGYQITESQAVMIENLEVVQWQDSFTNERGFYYQIDGENILIYGTASFEEQINLLNSLTVRS
jgi:hypothetical protein